MAVTTSHGPKPFSWSYSRLKNYEACPKKHYEVDLQKSFKEGDSEQLQWGNIVHDGMAARCGPKRVPLPSSMASYEKWVAPILATPGEILVEQQLSLAKDFSACGYFAGNCWFRAKGDLIKLGERTAMILDWKTGKVKPDSAQLWLSAACVFAKYPQIKKIRSSYVWLQENATTDEDLTPEDLPAKWRGLWPRIQAMEQAWNTTTYQAKQGGLCRLWCPVKSCPHNGE
jgi:hypothetical protein